jgi:uncharacterized protein (TIGR02246 family)
MKRCSGHWLLGVLGLLGLSAAAAADQADDEAAIRKNVGSYTAAFNKQDAKALGAHWMPEAVYIDPDFGTKVIGRPAIEKHFASVFKRGKDVKLVVKVESIKFVSPHVAVEYGTARVVGADKESEESSYTAIHVKSDGKWLLDRVTEEEQTVLPSSYEKLKELEWMVGSWVDDDDDADVETTCQWSKNQNFLVRSFTISVRNDLKMSGMQLIGWDPVAKQIRSWVFDSDGGFGEGLWHRKGDRWYIQNRDTLANGQKSSSLNILTFVNKNTFTWQSVNRQSAGRILPNVGEIVVIRKDTQKDQ